MKLSAVTLARYIAFIEIWDLNPRGAVRFLDLVQGLVQKCGFAKYPQKYEELDVAKGFILEGGKLGEIKNLQLHVFAYGLAVDTLSSTADSEAALDKLLWWAFETFKIHYNADMIKRKAYLSQLSFYSDFDLNMVNEAVKSVSEILTKRVNEIFGMPLAYALAGTTWMYDATSIKNGPSPFTIERRADTPFTENKYFSQAPLPTEEHIKLLEDFELAISRVSKPK